MMSQHDKDRMMVVDRVRETARSLWHNLSPAMQRAICDREVLSLAIAKDNSSVLTSDALRNLRSDVYRVMGCE